MHNFLFLQNLQNSAEQKPKLKKNRSLPGCPWNKKQNKNWRKQNKTKVDKIPPLPGCPWGVSSNSGNGERPRSKIAAIVNHFIHMHRFRNWCNKSAPLFCKLTNSSFSSRVISSCFAIPWEVVEDDWLRGCAEAIGRLLPSDLILDNNCWDKITPWNGWSTNYIR